MPRYKNKHQDLIDLFKRYRQNQGKLTMLVMQIEKAEKGKITKNDLMPSCTSSIGDGIHASGKTDSMTERAVERLAKMGKTIDKQVYEIQKMIDEAHGYKEEMDIVDIMIQSLPDLHRFVMNAKYVRGLEWRGVAEEVQAEFNKTYYESAGGHFNGLEIVKNQAIEQVKPMYDRWKGGIV